MWLILVGVIVAALWYFEVGWFAQMSGWWVLAPFAAAVIWFKVFERILGFNKKSSHDELEEAKKARYRKNMEDLKRGRVRR